MGYLWPGLACTGPSDKKHLSRGPYDPPTHTPNGYTVGDGLSGAVLASGGPTGTTQAGTTRQYSSEGTTKVAAKTYTVTGMTCGHCVSAVGGEVGKIPGVESVHVDLASGMVTVTGDGFADEAVRDAVDEAGYALVDA
jgi:copper chaperone